MNLVKTVLAKDCLDVLKVTVYANQKQMALKVGAFATKLVSVKHVLDQMTLQIVLKFRIINQPHNTALQITRP
jgi:hypothetical protein